VEYEEARRDRHVAAPPHVVTGVIGSLGLSDMPAMRTTVADIYSRTFRRVWTRSLNAEISSFADRFGIEPPRRARPTLSDVAGKLERRLLLNRGVRARFERHYIDERLPVDAQLHRNVRVTNVGRTPWASYGSRAIYMSYRWRTAAGELVGPASERTRFPIVIQTGRTISLPLRIRTPGQPGDYTLQVALVRGADEWLAEPQLSVGVDVRPDAATSLPPMLRRSNDEHDYARDHEVGIALLREYLRPAAGDRALRVLEIGGGPSPQIGPLEGIDAVNIDIVAPLLELGAVLYGAESSRRLQFLCCDALAPPFVASSFDAVVMFSTLHHFPEPEVLLRKCRELVTDDGLIAVMCEPVGDTLEHPTTVRDLLAGINEQVFSIEEYLALFDRAGLAVESGQLDGGSLKLFLRPLLTDRRNDPR
jgi:SAM-dependent methyltransferase